MTLKKEMIKGAVKGGDYMDIENLKDYLEEHKKYDDKIGDYKVTINNYSTLCSILGEEVKKGNSRKAQEREWQRYFEYDRAGVLFIIKEIYDEPLMKQDKGKYINPIDILHEYELYKILQRQDNGIYNFNFMELAEELNYINSNYRYYKNKQGELTHKIFGLTGEIPREEFFKKYKIVHDLYMWIEDKYEYRIKKALEKLSDTGMAVIHQYFIGFKKSFNNDFEDIEIKNQYGDIESKGIYAEYVIQDKERLSKDEEQTYFDIKAEELNKYSIDGKQIVEPKELRRLGINQTTGKSFYDEWLDKVAKRAKKELGYDKISLRYEIVTSQLFVDNKVEELEYNIRRKGINKRFYEGLLNRREIHKNKLIEIAKRENEIINEDGFQDLSEIEQMIKLVQGFDKKELKKKHLIDDIVEAEKCSDREKAINQRYKKEKGVIDTVVLIENKNKL